MATRLEMMDWLCEALEEKDGEATIRYLAKAIWARYEHEIRTSEKLLYTWQYDMRWAAFELRKEGRMASTSDTPRGTWALKYRR